MMGNKKALPFGIVTIALVAVTWAYSWFSKSDCVVLEQNMTQGYFLRWMEPKLLLVTANQQSHIVEAQSKEQACSQMMKELRIQ
ncbi:hypothetical protein NBRC116188_17720 [Oceaniserpentilla sp. 4NH20-0058]|uniref:hypothetical protein n=1 Tax=Oceaniserpentilla sp. 4NH20-0058 TaxID=3127660 RepID=UPI0031024922